MAQVRLKIKARAWRTETFVYSATVTVNGLPVGIIDRAGWRDWLMVISDPTVLGADRLVVGIKSTPFRFDELYPDLEDDRELGVSVSRFQIEPQSNMELGLLNHLTLPPTDRIAFGIILGVATYLFSCCLGARPRSALYHSLIAVIGFAILLAFYGLVADPTHSDIGRCCWIRQPCAGSSNLANDRRSSTHSLFSHCSARQCILGALFSVSFR